MVVIVVGSRGGRSSELVRGCVTGTVTASIEGVASDWTALVAECRRG